MLIHYIPDLIATVNGRDLLIEVFVTHSVDQAKKEKIKSLGISALEIDLSDIPRDMGLAAVEQFVVNVTHNKSWIYNARSQHEYGAILQQTQIKETTTRGFALHVDFCPLKVRTWNEKPHANVIDDCIYCESCVEFKEGTIRCNGHLSTVQKYMPKLC